MGENRVTEINETIVQEVRQFKAGIFSRKKQEIIREIPLEIVLNGEPIATIACSGRYAAELAVGFLRSEGLLAAKEEIATIKTAMKGRRVQISTKTPVTLNRSGHKTIASSGARGIMEHPEAPGVHGKAKAPMMLTPETVFKLMDELMQKATLHDSTGGTHSAALATRDGLTAVREDIGRHNAIDMLGGYALLEKMDCTDKIIVRTGRVSSEIVHKIRRLGIPVVISISVPTTMAVTLAAEAGITLIGAVRDRKFIVYSHEERMEGVF